MKTLKIFITALSVLSILISCEQVQALDDDLIITEASTDNSPMETMYFSTDSNSINSAENLGLLLMREEEKMAHDVYTQLYEKYKMRIFGNIAKSESKHTDAVLRLINHFNLTDPALDQVGEFQSDEISKLYNALMEKANTLDNALKTGAYIEEFDIADLKKLIAETENQDIKMVYGNLLKGSYNHLKAFTRVLSLRGIEYVPEILSQDEYNEIVQK